MVSFLETHFSYLYCVINRSKQRKRQHRFVIGLDKQNKHPTELNTEKIENFLNFCSTCLDS